MTWFGLGTFMDTYLLHGEGIYLNHIGCAWCSEFEIEEDIETGIFEEKVMSWCRGIYM
jgi:hypothetical protein